jgi:prepilin-type N-terminal cleavage/methylation domain-containing protein
MGRSALKNNGGMTLVEVLVALAITFIIFLGLSDAGLVVLNENIKNSIRDEAVSVAEADVQAVRNIPFASLPTADNTVTFTPPPRMIRGLNATYSVTRSIRYLDPENRELTVNVDWTRQQKSYNHRVITIVRQR